MTPRRNDRLRFVEISLLESFRESCKRSVEGDIGVLCSRVFHDRAVNVICFGLPTCRDVLNHTRTVFRIVSSDVDDALGYVVYELQDSSNFCDFLSFSNHLLHDPDYFVVAHYRAVLESH